MTWGLVATSPSGCWSLCRKITFLPRGPSRLTPMRKSPVRAMTSPSGNANSGATDSNNYAVDTVRPTVSIVVDDTALNIGDDALVTFTLSNTGKR